MPNSPPLFPPGWTHEPPSETVRPATRRDVVRLVAGAAVFVILANLLAVVVLDLHNPNRGNWLVLEKGRRATEAPAVETLVLGDSSCNQGLRPSGLAAALGGPAYNLCTIGTLSLTGDVVLLDRYLATHPPPKRVIVSHAPDVWYRLPSLFTLGLLRPGSEAQAGLSALGWGGVVPRVKMLVGHWLPLYGATLSLADLLREPFDTWGRTYTLDADGFMEVTTFDPDRLAQDMRDMIPLVRAARGRLPGANAAALRVLAERARTHGFQLHLVPSAVAAEVAGDPEFVAYAERLWPVVEAELAGTPGAGWTIREFLPYPAAQMELTDHLLSAAADDFTARVAAAVRAREAGGGG